MRKNEMLKMKCGQIDMANGIIKLYGESTKNGKSRIIPLSLLLSGVLKKTERINEWVFNFKGSHLRNIRTAFGVACERAKIENFRFHDLRHCIVTRKRREGVPDRVIMVITAHQTMECFKRYDAISVDDLKRAVGGHVPENLEQSWNTGLLKISESTLNY